MPRDEMLLDGIRTKDQIKDFDLEAALREIHSIAKVGDYQTAIYRIVTLLQLELNTK